ncbi:MAG: hypothetical protein Q9217_005404 [Psora testacea]
MRLTEYRLYFIALLTTTTSALLPSHHARALPRSLDAILVERQGPAPSPPSSPVLRHLNLPHPAPTTSFIRHLDLRQVAAPQPGAAQPAANAQAQPAANAQAQPGANAQAQPDANAPAQPGGNAQAAPVAPAANPAPPAPAPLPGVGGGAGQAGAQPAPGAQANPVTTIYVQTVVGGVTTTVPELYTQSFGDGVSAPPVQTGSIGMGTLTGEIGVVKTGQAKSDATAEITRHTAPGHLIQDWRVKARKSKSGATDHVIQSGRCLKRLMIESSWLVHS